MTNCSIRPANPDDIAFIYSTWLKSYRYDSEVGKQCRNSVFFSEYREVIDRILAKEDTKVLVACLSSDSQIILGYLVSEPQILHYTFVKEAWQRLGIAKRLYREAFGEGKSVSISHRTFLSEPILQKNQNLIFNPFLLYSKGENNDEKQSIS